MKTSVKLIMASAGGLLPEIKMKVSVIKKSIQHSGASTLPRLATIAAALALTFAPGRSLAARPLGVDVSSYQGGSINWTSVKGTGITFAWAKATEATTVADADFVVNENNGKSAGVIMGAYHFAHPELDTPASEASYFWSHAGGYIKADGKTLMPMADMEVFTGLVGASTYSIWVNDFCDDIVADAAAVDVKVTPFIYVSACHAGNFNSSVAQWFSDIADYNGESSQTGTPWSVCSGDDVWGAGVWTAWQYSDAGSVSGISGNVDEDVYNGTSVSAAVATAINIPPSITTQPVNQTVNQGQNATFSVVATGSTPLSYQWTFNSANISGATASSYTVVSAQSTNAGSYAVVVTNTAGSATSSTATLTVIIPPSITTQPVNQTVNQGQNATFSVVASGTAPLSYQWTFNSANISGATASSYTVTNAQSANAGSYAVVVTNAAGSVTSSTATLTVILPPIISTQPVSQLASVSNNVTFTVALSQGTSPAYQWTLNGTAIGGATQSSLTLSSILWGSAGTYAVVVTNAAGSVTSANAVLTVEQGQFTYVDGFESYAVGVLDRNDSGGPNAGGANPWWGPGPTNISIYNSINGVTPHSGTNLVGGTVGTSISQAYINLPFRMDSGQLYYGNLMCDWWFYDPFGTGANGVNFADYFALAQYTPVSLTNDFVTTTFTSYNQRVSLGAFNGAGYNKSNYQARVVGATGGFNANGWFNTAVPRTIGWHHGRIVVGIPVANSAPISMFIDNMSSPAFTYPNSGVTVGFNLLELNANMTGAANGGYYDDLTFQSANDPWIAQQPSSLTNDAGTSATFTTVAVGTAYQWQFDGGTISGATNSGYTLSNVQTNNAGSYTCIITGTNGTVATTPATLTVIVPPSISTQPANQAVHQGQNATFSVVAVGTAPLSYQWTFNSGNISGATASSYTVTNAQSANAGSYAVVVTNAGGSATSSTATLTVIVPPSITTQPVNQTVNQGQNATFSVVAAGTAPLSYQWTFNSANISGATASSYTVVSAQSTNAGSYAVVVTNSAGSATSSTATLTVNIPPSITTQPVNQTVNQGQNATFSVVASGTAPLSYQWTFNSANISGATASSYTVTNAQSANAGSYAVVVTNAAGSVTSSTATLTVILPPIISTQPVSQLASVSNNVTFTVALSQGTSPAYQWTLNGTAIGGATQSSLTLSSILWGSAGTYAVVVTNAAGSVTSANAVLTVEQGQFTYVDGFESYAVGVLDRNDSGGPNAGGANPWWGPGPTNISIYNSINGVTPHSGTNLVGGTVGTSISQAYINLPFRMDSGQLYYGNLMCDWWFYDPFGTGANGVNFADYFALAQYTPVSLTNDFVTTTFTSYNQRVSLGAFNGAGYNKSNYQARVVGATGGFNANGWFNTAVPRTIGWHHGRIVVGIPVANSAPISMFIDNMSSPAFTYPNSGVTVGFNLLELNANMTGAANGGYYDDLTFQSANDPWIAQQPSSLTNDAGTSATFTTVAVGTAYQWQFDGGTISGATNSGYTLTNVQTNNAGTYTCIITGTNGTVATTPATLTVP